MLARCVQKTRQAMAKRGKIEQGDRDRTNAAEAERGGTADGTQRDNPGD